jgi:hypothetical protein
VAPALTLATALRGTRNSAEVTNAASTFFMP